MSVEPAGVPEQTTNDSAANAPDAAPAPQPPVLRAIVTPLTEQLAQAGIDKHSLPRGQEEKEWDGRSSRHVQKVFGQAKGIYRHSLGLPSGRSRTHQEAAQAPGLCHVLTEADDQEVHRPGSPIARQGSDGRSVDGVDLPSRQGLPEAGPTRRVHVKGNGPGSIWHGIPRV